MVSSPCRGAFALLFGLSLSLLSAEEATPATRLEDLVRQKEELERRIKEMERKPKEAAPAETKTTSPERRDDLTVLVTATRRATPADRVGRAYTVIDGADLRGSGATEVLEALRRVPGLNPVQTGGRGGTTSLFGRGGESNFTMVMVDGHPITADGGVSDLGNIMVDDVERIEVIRGPISSYYGSAATTGAVNIITKKGQGPFTLNLTSSAGTFGTFKEVVEVSGSEEKFDYMFSESYFKQSNGRWENNDYQNNTVSGNFGIRPSEKIDFRFMARSIEDEKGAFASSAGPAFDMSDPNDETKNDQILLGADALLQANDVWSIQVKSSYYDQDVDFVTVQDEIFDTSDSVFSTLYERTSNTVYNTFAFSEMYTLGLGYDGIEENGRNTFNTSVFEREIHSGYIQNQLNFDDRLYLDVGGRLDNSTKFKDEFTGNAAAALHFRDAGTKMRGSVGTGIKAPTFFEIKGSNTTQGLEMLGKGATTEKNLGWDLGIDQKIAGDVAEVKVTYFESHIRNLTEFLTHPVTGNSYYDQGGKNRSKGWEFETDIKLGERADLVAQWTLMQHRVMRTETTGTAYVVGDSLIRQPHSAGTILLDTRPTENLGVNVNAQYRGDRDDLDFKVDTSGRRVENDDYWLGNAAVNFDGFGVEGLRAFGSVENIFNVDYEEVYGFPGERTNFLGGLNWSRKF